MNDKKKRFLAPQAQLIDFINEDIITTSGLRDGGYLNEDVGGGDNVEEFDGGII